MSDEFSVSLFTTSLGRHCGTVSGLSPEILELNFGPKKWCSTAVEPLCSVPLGMAVLTVFRSRLRAGVELDYQRVAEEMDLAVAAMDGFIDQKFYVATDGERVTIVRFRDWESQRRWAEYPSHREAQRRGREEFYSWYDIHVCEERLSHEFQHPDLL